MISWYYPGFMEHSKRASHNPTTAFPLPLFISCINITSALEER
jgi:hypothetical protein